MSAVAIKASVREAAVASPPRPVLYLVPSEGRRPSPAESARALRLTQRGRLVRTLVAFAVLSLLVSLALAKAFGSPGLVADHATTVLPGQTLTDIARVELPDLPLHDGVSMLRELNGLSSATIVAGQSLLVPAV